MRGGHRRRGAFERHVRKLDLTVDAINLPLRLARLNIGVVVPITTLFDDDGEKTTDADEAVVFVCGSDTLQAWFTGRIDGFGG